MWRWWTTETVDGGWWRGEEAGGLKKGWDGNVFFASVYIQKILGG